MPKEFVDFLICDTYTIEDLQRDADIPDQIDKDNIENDCDVHHCHSYKMQEVTNEKGTYLKWIDGDCLQKLKFTCSDCRDYIKEGKLDMARYCISKVTHYLIDGSGGTSPHNFRGKPWSTYHTKFENDLGIWIIKNKEILEKQDYKFNEFKDIYKSCRKTVIDRWQLGKEIVNKYENGIKLTDEEKLEICYFCICQVGNLWTTLGKELKIIK